MTNDKEKTIVASVLSVIKKEGIHPRPRWQFMAKNGTLWSVWGMSVVVGASAVAAMLFAMLHAGWVYQAATHNSWIEFAFDVLPFAWAGVLVVMIGVAYANIKHTKYGYRYPLWVIIGASVGCSFLGGTVLYAVGAGAIIDDRAGRLLPFYRPTIEMQRGIWTHPEEGRLAGLIDITRLDDEGVFTLTTFADENNATQTWLIEADSLREPDMNILAHMSEVRVVGVPVEEDASVLHACFVFPWGMPHMGSTGNPMPAGMGIGMGEKRGSPVGERSIIIVRELPGERNDDEARSSECEGIVPYKQLRTLQNTNF